MMIYNKNGNTLLIVIVSIFVLLSIVLYLNKFVVNQNKISINPVDIKNSLYSAESGIERTLFLIRKNNIDFDDIIQNNFYNLGMLNNGSSYKILSSATSDEQNDYISIPLISANTSYSMDLTNYKNIKSVKIYWDAEGNEIYNVVLARYRNGRFISNVVYDNFSHFYDSPVVINFNIQNNSSYIFTITSRNYNSIDNKIIFYSQRNANGDIINLNSNNNGQIIKSIGNINNVNKPVISDFLINNNY